MMNYFDILECNPKIPSRFEKDSVEWLFNRYYFASVKTEKFSAIFFNLREEVFEEKFNEFKKNVNITTNLEEIKIIFEFARGDKRGFIPLKPPFG